MPWLLKKSYWFIWGSDLYAYTLRKASFNRRLWEIVRYLIIRNIGNLVTYIPGDIKLARQWYKARGRYHECLMYSSNVVANEGNNLPKIKLAKNNELYLLIGNSGDPSNNHLEIFEMLKIILQMSQKSLFHCLMESYHISKKCEGSVTNISEENFNPWII